MMFSPVLLYVTISALVWSVTADCGILPKNTNLIKRIIGGEETEAHEWPSICWLHLPGNYQCGGTLVKNNRGKFFLLSAAHCFFDRNTKNKMSPGGITVYCGIHDLDGDRPNNVQTFKVRRIATPKDFNKNRLDYGWDIAVIWLDHQPEENRHVQAACLPSSDHHDGERALVAGWGSPDGSSPSTTQLHDLRVTINSDQYCKQHIEQQGWKYGGSNRVLCAGRDANNRGSSVCFGDSGGPLYTRRQGYWTLTGIVSFGPDGCALRSGASTFTDVYDMRDWIDSNINSRRG